MSVADQDLVDAAADAAMAADRGRSVPASVVSLLRAIASTRTELERHKLARESIQKAGALGEAALHVLRVAIFALA